MLHVAVDARQLAILEDRQSDNQHAVLVLRVLDDEEEAEVARLPGAHHGGQVEEADYTCLLLLETKLAFNSSTSLSTPLLVKSVDNLRFCTKSG